MNSRVLEVYPDAASFLKDARCVINDAPKTTNSESDGYEGPSMGLMNFILRTFHCDVAYDIGAGWGQYARAVADLGGKSVTTHAFEMRHDFYERLVTASRSTRPGAGQIVPHRAGLSDHHEGMRDIWFSRTRMFETEPPPSHYREAWHRRLKFALRGVRNRDQLYKQAVLLTSVDALTASTGIPQFIKIDVDGYEGKILSGSMDCMAMHRPFVLLELHKDELIERTGWSRRKIAELMRDVGYGAALLTNHDSAKKSELIDLSNGDTAPFDAQRTMHFLFY